MVGVVGMVGVRGNSGGLAVGLETSWRRNKRMIHIVITTVTTRNVCVFDTCSKCL